MTNDTKTLRRKSIRLKDCDYSRAGAYFITICTHERQALLGQIVDGQMQLNSLGEIVQAVWFALTEHYAHIHLGVFVVMPNHVHGIIEIKVEEAASSVGVGLKPTPTRHGLSEIVRALKTFSARRINEKCAKVGNKVWQRNYYEHVIRSEASYLTISKYIQTNPQRWAEDRYFVAPHDLNG
ncbi:MAG: transposase [Burkholderiaceae bacterium]